MELYTTIMVFNHHFASESTTHSITCNLANLVRMNHQALFAALLLVVTHSDISLALVAPHSCNFKLAAQPRSTLYSSLNGVNDVHTSSRYAANNDFEPRCVIRFGIIYLYNVILFQLILDFYHK